jgi:hypothetical protein
MQVTRILKIDSITNLYQILLNKENIVQQSETLIRFKNHMESYLTGCLCESDVNYQISIDIYRSLNLSVDLYVWEELKNKISCQSIVFYEKTGDNCKFLFEV